MSVVSVNFKRGTRANYLSAFKELLEKEGLLNYYSNCCICGWNKAAIDLAHITPHAEGGLYAFDNIVPLCPNHHRQLDRWLINETELENIQHFLWNIDGILSSR